MTTTTMTMTPERRHFLDRLAAFRDATADLLDAWPKTDDEGAEGYPDIPSFDELLGQVDIWFEVQSAAPSDRARVADALCWTPPTPR